MFVEQLCFCFVQAPAYILNRVEKGDNYCKMLQRLVCLEFVVSNILHFSLLILYGTKPQSFLRHLWELSARRWKNTGRRKSMRKL